MPIRVTKDDKYFGEMTPSVSRNRPETYHIRTPLHPMPELG
jgi:hypothetical protein